MLVLPFTVLVIADTLAEGIEKSKESIDSGKALEVLNKLVGIYKQIINIRE